MGKIRIPAHIVLVGDIHPLPTSPDHWMEAIEEVYDWGRLTAVGIEVISSAFQGLLDEFIFGDMDYDEFQKAYFREVEKTIKDFSGDLDRVLNEAKPLFGELAKFDFTREEEKMIPVINFMQDISDIFKSMVTGKDERVLEFCKKNRIRVLALGLDDPEGADKIFSLLTEFLSTAFEFLRQIIEYKEGKITEEEFDAKTPAKLDELGKDIVSLRETDKLFGGREEHFVAVVEKHLKVSEEEVVVIVGEAHLNPLGKRFRRLGLSVEVRTAEKMSKEEFDMLPPMYTYLEFGGLDKSVRELSKSLRKFEARLPKG